MTVACNKDLRVLERQAIDQGWTVEHMGNNHLKWTPPDGNFVFTSNTPGDGSGVRKAKAELIKAGLITKERRMPRRSSNNPHRVNVVNKAKLPSPRLDFGLDLTIMGTEKEAMLERARILLGLPFEASIAEVQIETAKLTEGQRDVLVELMASDERPEQTCPCGRTFANLLYAHLHRQRCSVITEVKQEPVIEPEPVLVPEPRQIEEESVTVVTKRTARVWTCDKCDPPRTMSVMGKGRHLASHKGGGAPPMTLVSCKYCHKPMQKRSFTNHILRNCALAPGTASESDWYLTPDQPKAEPEVFEAHEREVAQVLAAPMPDLVGPTPESTPVPAPAPVPAKRTVETDDELIEEMLDLLFPDGFKAKHLSAIAKWSDATRSLLEVMHRG